MTLEEAERKYHIRGIPAAMVERFWLLAEPYVKRALDTTSGEFTPADIRMLCKDRVMQLWLVTEGERVVAAVTTEIVVYPQYKNCRVATIGGTKAVEWTGLLTYTLNEWAREQGCKNIEAFVRKGYVNVLSNYGFKHKYSAVFKPIE